MPSCVVLGDRSDIARGLKPLMEADGWVIHGWHRGNSLPSANWDLMLIAMGAVAPVGPWEDADENEWEACIQSNLLLPIAYLRRLWNLRNVKAQVCFMAGSNPNMIMDGYSAYNVAKMGLLKAVEQLDHEAKNEKIFALAPGIVLTKIHEATLKANWPNPKLQQAVQDQAYQVDIDAKIADVYRCLKWCLDQPKMAVGGRNICVSDLKQEMLSSRLSLNPSMFKLRRAE